MRYYIRKPLKNQSAGAPERALSNGGVFLQAGLSFVNSGNIIYTVDRFGPESSADAVMLDF